MKYEGRMMLMMIRKRMLTMLMMWVDELEQRGETVSCQHCTTQHCSVLVKINNFFRHSSDVSSWMRSNVLTDN